MSRLFYHVMQDNVGNLLFDVSGTMRVAGSGTLATIYGDEALTVILPNPMTNHPSFGSFKCFLGAGDFDFYMAKAGYTFETLTGVQGHGTMAQQDANNVAITGGNATGLASLEVLGPAGFGTAPVSGQHITTGAFPSRFNGAVGMGIAPDAPYQLKTAAIPVWLGGNLGVRRAPSTDVALHVDYLKGSVYGLVLHTADSDTGANAAALFTNVAGTPVGSITTSATTTAFNTTSDGRLKEAIRALPHALETIQQLLPVQFRWKATGEVGQGFLAQDVQPVVPQAVSGDPTDPAPTMQMDLSKLVPHLVGAVKELAAQVETLTARLAALEGA